MHTKPKTKRKLKPIVKKKDSHNQKQVNRFENKLDKLLASALLKNIYIAKLDHVKNRKWTLNEINAVADSMLIWFKQKKNYWFKNFAIEMDIPYRLFREKFYKESEYFAYIFDLCKDIQESKLFELGIGTRSSMPIFALKNVSKWRDKQEHEHIIKDVKDIKKEIEEVFEQ
jgi:hypothetical protein